MCLRKSREVGVLGNEVREARAQLMQSLVGHRDSFGFDCKIESLEAFQPGREAIQLIFCKDHSGCCLGNGLEDPRMEAEMGWEAVVIV